ncbi:MAG: tRNA uridine-5-carboxymethylaminomethyl(34) synthesis GTPase MnmE [Candidatus Cloacimonas sp.]|jgi:tRNA modification GTPase|nr:tRNA uridine-5-carboxymethylaminomethyl(34) synthesis GTPase MnmE [Candidatus Cloacimonas sp.]
MASYSEAICAPITPAGYAAIAVLRISGSDAISIVAKHFRPSNKLLKSPTHRVLHGTFYSETGQAIDEVLLSVFRSPTSYTGEDSVEISCHGNPNLANRILSSLLLHARLARAGEFTLRAYLNGKLDLSQAEAVNDLIHAQASKAESAALMQVQGKLSHHLQLLLTQITDARLRCELAIDFSDQDLPQINLIALQQQLSGILQAAEELSAKGEQGRKIREGTKICLSGAPNAGKSSLFNALLQYGRALVTPHPGTTRDYLEESISLNGFPLVIYDTAGLRQSSDEIESQGIAKSIELMHEADLIIYLIDSTSIVEQNAVPDKLTTESTEVEQNATSVPSVFSVVNSASFGTWGVADAQQLSAKTITVYSKADLLTVGASRARPNHPYSIFCSVNTPNGLDALTKAILNRLLLSDELLSKPLVTNARHLAALSRCIESLHMAISALESSAGFEFIAFELISASRALEEILGVITTDDLLENIFSNFCIGK